MSPDRKAPLNHIMYTERTAPQHWSVCTPKGGLFSSCHIRSECLYRHKGSHALDIFGIQTGWLLYTGQSMYLGVCIQTARLICNGHRVYTDKGASMHYPILGSSTLARALIHTGRLI